MRNYFSHRLFSILLTIAMASTALFFLGGWSSGYQPDSKQLMKSIDFHAAVSENGNVRVTEVWNVSLGSRDKPYRNFYRTFKTGDVQAGAISDLSVYDADLGTSYTFAGDIDPESISDDSLARQCYIHKMSDGTEIGWFMPGIRKGTRTFRVSYTIQQLVVDHLHVLGDIYDRGDHPELIMERLMSYHSVDIQWGNHDMLWVGASSGSASSRPSRAGA